MNLTWKTGTPSERAEMVRRHVRNWRKLSRDQICELFNLTEAGLDAINSGYDWKPEYEKLR